MVADLEEEAWLVLTNQVGEALLDVERTFMEVVSHHGAPRLARDEAAQTYLRAWARLASVHRLLSDVLLK
jgi:hypothetical protein